MKRFAKICAVIFLLPLLLIPTTVNAAPGNNVTWSYDEATRTLTVSGTGTMESCSASTVMPWSELLDKIEYVVIQNGVTSITDRAFFNMPRLKEIAIPKSVTSIGSCAFQYSGLSDITLPDGVTRIGPYAFSCTNLKEITLPAGLKKLELGTFWSCANLRSVVLREGLTEIGCDAFSDCTALESISLPNSVTVIEAAFKDCITLTSVTLVEGLTAIPEACFQGCRSLQIIHIPNSVETVDRHAFENCTALDTVAIGTGTTSIHPLAFQGCTSLKRLDVESENPALHNDQNGALYTKDLTRFLLLPPGYAGEYAVLDGTQSIDADAACECLGLTALTLPDSVTVIEDRAFSGCRALASLALGSQLRHIHEEAFKDCSALETITFPASLAQVDEDAFHFCAGLKTVTFSGNCPVFAEFVFTGSNADAYYPADDSSWNMDLSVVGPGMVWQPRCRDAHTFVTKAAVPPTCIAFGQTKTTYCSICGFTTVAPTELPMVDHCYGSWVYNTPAGTSEERHVVRRVCEVCGRSQRRYATDLDPAQLPDAPTEAPQPVVTPRPSADSRGIWITLAVIGAVVICFIGVELILIRKKK